MLNCFFYNDMNNIQFARVNFNFFFKKTATFEKYTNLYCIETMNYRILSTDLINSSSFLIDFAARKNNSVEAGKIKIT